MDFLDRDLVNPDDVTPKGGLKLLCNATGGNIKYQWKFKGDYIKSVFISPSGTLSKKYPDESSNGKYQCYVSNSRGSSFSREIDVKVTGN